MKYSRVYTAFLIVIIFASSANALEMPSREMEFGIPEIDRTFVVSGDKFTLIETEEGTTSVWEGSVCASSQQIVIKTERLELYLTPDDNVRSIKAGPDVTIDLVEDAASARISGSMFEYDFETETGHVGNSVIELKANPLAFDLPPNYNYWIYILADKTELIQGDLFVRNPTMRLNSLENPQVEVRGKELSIKTHGQERRLRIRKVSVVVFGYKVFYFPWGYDKLLTKRGAGGFSSDPPRFGFGDGGLEIDQKFFYTFVNPPLENKAFVFRFDVFTNDRWYPEIMFSDMSAKRSWDLKYGYERLDDNKGDYVRVFRKPDFSFRFPKADITRHFTFSSGFDYGRVEEPNRNVDETRLTLHAALSRKPIVIGNPRNTLHFNGEYRKSFYSKGVDYEVFTRSVGIKHIEDGRYSLSATYYHRDDNGLSPFLHEQEEILDELKSRNRFRFSQSWGGGVDTRYDFERSHFRDLELVITRIYDSFQVSLKWDFADSRMKVEFGLPGAL